MGKEGGNTRIVSIAVDKKNWQEIKKIGKKENMSASLIVRQWMKEGLERYRRKGSI